MKGKRNEALKGHKGGDYIDEPPATSKPNGQIVSACLPAEGQGYGAKKEGRVSHCVKRGYAIPTPSEASLPRKLGGETERDTEEV